MTELLSTETVFAATCATMGGAAALAQIRSAAALAWCTSPHGPCTTELRAVRGGRLWFRQTWPAREPFTAVINGSRGWTYDSQTGAAQPLDPSQVALIRSYDLQLLPLEWPWRYHDRQIIGEQHFIGQPCVALAMTDELDRPCRAFVRAASPLLLGLQLADPRGNGQLQIIFEQWRWVKGVLLPDQVITSDSNGDCALYFERITINSVDPTIFDRPELA